MQRWHEIQAAPTVRVARAGLDRKRLRRSWWARTRTKLWHIWRRFT